MPLKMMALALYLEMRCCAAAAALTVPMPAVVLTMLKPWYSPPMILRPASSHTVPCSMEV